MRRESRGKRLVLTERDLKIFRLLERYRYLNSEYLHAFVGGQSGKRFKERLGDLFHEGLINRPESQWDCAAGRHQPVIYESGERSGRLQRQYVREYDRAIFPTSHRPHQFQHSTMICHVLAAVELLTRQKLTIDIIGWSEILRKAPIALQRAGKPYGLPLSMPGSPAQSGDQARFLIPDALFGVRYNELGSTKYRFFALEFDRGTMPIRRSAPRASSYQRKLLSYQEVLDRRLFKSLWGLPNLMVLTISSNPIHLQHLLECAEKHLRIPSPFLFKALGEGEVTQPDRAKYCLNASWRSVDGRTFDIWNVNG